MLSVRGELWVVVDTLEGEGTHELRLHWLGGQFPFRAQEGALELDGGLSDITTFAWDDGLSWEMGGGKTRHEPDLTQWLGKRAGVGKRPPYGFPRNYKFN